MEDACQWIYIFHPASMNIPFDNFMRVVCFDELLLDEDPHNFAGRQLLGIAFEACG